MELLFYYFLIFFIYSFLGWMIETINCSIMAKKKILNRGFLIGPYIPIYGTGALVMILFLTEYKKDPFVLFCMAVVYCSLIEYITSYLMEKLFLARWWDYTHEKFNLNGRICLKNSLLFGVLGVILMYVIHPSVELLLAKVPSNILVTISYIAFLIFFLNIIVTILLLAKLDIEIKNIKSDATEEIDKEMKKLLIHYRVLYKRLFKAFPKININTERGNMLIDRIRSQLDEFDDLIEKKKKEIASIKEKIKKLKDDNLTKEKLIKEKEKLKSNLKEVKKRKIK